VAQRGLDVVFKETMMDSDARVLRRWFCADGVDLVNFGDYRGFMLVQDNLYKISVSEAHKRFPVERHYRDLQQHGCQASPVTRGNVDGLRDAQWGIYILLDHLIRRSVRLSVLDVGAFVGDVGIRYGNYMRTIGHDGRVYCFDPSLAGELIPYNIELNGLGGYVTYCPYAVSDTAGFLTFYQRQGHSDSAATSRDGTEANTIVESIRLSEFVRERGIEHAFIKLDTENLEPRILADISAFLQTSGRSPVAFEFHAAQREMHPMLMALLRTHILFDIGYLPHPFCFRHVTAEGIGRFISECGGRPYGYTDVLAISRTTPDLEVLVKRLAELAEQPAAYSLVYD
jgi:FkbM family methyltransferase